MVFHWSLSDSKSLQVFMTLLNILAHLNNAVVRMVSTRPFISKSSSPCLNSLVTVPRTIGIIVTFMFHSFFRFPCKVVVLILIFTFFQFYSVIIRDRKVHNSASSLFFFFLLFFLLLTITRSCRLAEIRWSICISKSRRSLYVSFSRRDTGLCIYHLFVWSNFNFLNNSQWITLPIQSLLLLLLLLHYQ